MRSRHARHFLALAETAEPELTQRVQVAWLDRLVGDHENLRAALRYLTEQQPSGLAEGASTESSIDEGLRLAAALGRFWELRGHLVEGRAWVRTVLERDTGRPLNVCRPHALFAALRFAFMYGDYASAQALGEACLEVSRAVGEHELMAGALTQLGHLQRMQGHPEAARSLYEEGLAIRRELEVGGVSPFPAGTAISLKSLGDVAWALGDVGAAHAAYVEALAIERDVGHLYGMFRSQYRLGEIAGDRGKHVEARAHLSEVRSFVRQLRDPTNVAVIVGTIAGLVAAEGHGRAAMRLLGAADELNRFVGSAREPTATAWLERRIDWTASSR